MNLFFLNRHGSHLKRHAHQTARDFGRLVGRAIESGELETINYLLRPAVAALRYGTDAVEDVDTTVYIMSERFLSDAYHLLFDGVREAFKECFYYVGGFSITGPGKGHYVWDHPIQVEFSDQRACGVRVDMASGGAALDQLREMGLSLVGHFHSHPGCGSGANKPSETDARFVKSLAAGRSIALGAIFSRSATSDDEAFVRFYAHQSLHPFRVVIEGNGVKKLYENLFQIHVQPTYVAAQHVSQPPITSIEV